MVGETLRGEAPRERSVGEHIFIWIAWAACAAFWGASLTIIGGIVQAVTPPTAGGDAGLLLVNVVGWLVLAVLAMAAAGRMLARRTATPAPAREAATAALYDRLERQEDESGLRPAPNPERERGNRR
jgi:hypothetical protein